MLNRCYDCPHFNINYDPLISGGDCWDFGRASCKKHDLIVEFRSVKKLKKLECVEDEDGRVHLDDEQRPGT